MADGSNICYNLTSAKGKKNLTSDCTDRNFINSYPITLFAFFMYKRVSYIEMISDYLKVGLKVDLDRRIVNIIDKHAAIVCYPSKSIILSEGERASNLYFILRGIVRGYYVDQQGNDVTKCFASEHEFFSSEGIRTGNVASFSIECLDECRCIKLPYSLVLEVIEKDHRLRTVFYSFYLQEVEKLERRAKNLIVMRAEERYYDFCKHYPHLANRVDLQYIASYIGIRAPSLSRIRRTIKNIPN